MSNGELTRPADATAAAWMLDKLGHALVGGVLVGLIFGVVVAVLVLALSHAGLLAAVVLGSAVAAFGGALTFGALLRETQR